MKNIVRVLTFGLMLYFFLLGLFCQQACDTSPHKNGRKSMLGLGPYPQVSQAGLDMFLVPTSDDLWNGVEEIAKRSGEHLGLMEELKKRVRLKLLEQGIKTVGISARSQNSDNRTIRIYPLYPKVAYVRWKYKNDADGTPQRYAFNILGPADMNKVKHYFDRGSVPPGWEVKSYESDALDPYVFLGLERFPSRTDNR